MAQRKTTPAVDDRSLTNHANAPADAGSYTVVARRYRPQRFEDVVGQDHVVQALRNAIRLGRVTHAYLFSGTRGVGKTSIARIFAKCLNCVRGPTDEPCQQCDICQAIALGQDIDVVEIDGASNNGVEAVRELRQNAGLRPSRSRFKIYYIDEVHMLSTGAFNALLKTLEEPPAHVKFFFATTEPGKIPVTVLSRCQRYDFAGITPELIIATLVEICRQEHVEADVEALRAVARRAGGSMRDAQSLLEQLLSFAGAKLTAEAVHRALGIAPDERVLDLIDAFADHEPGRALMLLDQAVAAGIQPADVLHSLLELLRDVMILATAAEVAPLAAAPSQRPRIQRVVDRWPLDSILAALQILAEARGRLRGSPHGRTIVELALARVARLENLADLSELIERMQGLDASSIAPHAALPVGPTASPSVKKKSAPPPLDCGPAIAPEDPAAPLELAAVMAVWQALGEKVGFMLGTGLINARPVAVEDPSTLVILVPADYNWVTEKGDTPEGRDRIEQSLRELLGRPMRVRFKLETASAASASETAARAPAASSAGEMASDPLVQAVVRLFEARLVHVDRNETAAASE